jgi:hypothetical protein
MRGIEAAVLWESRRPLAHSLFFHSNGRATESASTLAALSGEFFMAGVRSWYSSGAIFNQQRLKCVVSSLNLNVSDERRR